MTSAPVALVLAKLSRVFTEILTRRGVSEIRHRAAAEGRRPAQGVLTEACRPRRGANDRDGTPGAVARPPPGRGWRLYMEPLGELPGDAGMSVVAVLGSGWPLHLRRASAWYLLRAATADILRLY